VTSSCGIEPTRLVYYKPILDEAIKISSYKPSTVILHQRDQVILKIVIHIYKEAVVDLGGGGVGERIPFKLKGRKYCFMQKSYNY
jgi:hypothetical protein